MRHRRFLAFLLSIATAMCIALSACGGATPADNSGDKGGIATPDENGSNKKPDDEKKDDGNNENPPPVESQGLKFYHDGDDESWVVDRGTCTDWDIIIPAYYDDLPVTGVSVDGFMRGQISSVYLPETVTTLNNRAFFDCNYLREINLTTSLTSIKWRALANTGLERVKIPESISVIESQVFYGCHNLVEVTIPTSVTEILAGAFLGCNYLEHINYSGTMFEWEQIEKGDHWDCGEGYSNEVFDWVPVPHAYTVHCIDGDISVN